VVAHTVCGKCIDDPVTPQSTCVRCGNRCHICGHEDYKGPPCPNTCGKRETVFRGVNTLNLFGAWLFCETHKYFTAVAHNSKSYDGIFLLNYLVNQSIRPDKIIYNGSKIMYLHVGRGLNIRLIDSLNFLPMKLSALPKSFGLTELKKGWFPHFFNKDENQHYVGPYPNPEYYGVDYMANKEREDFMRWHDTKKNEIFDFETEILEYCRSDVDILRQSCIKFRHLLMSATGTQIEKINKKGQVVTDIVGGVDPFDYTTIASGRNVAYQI